VERHEQLVQSFDVQVPVPLLDHLDRAAAELGSDVDVPAVLDPPGQEAEREILWFQCRRFNPMIVAVRDNLRPAEDQFYLFEMLVRL
jgi:hypothetical protein